MLNKCILVGRLTKDPESTSTPTGVLVTKFTIAVNKRFQRQGEERQADFINIVSFNKTAEFVQKYFKKGQAIIVSGSIQTRTYEKDGDKRYITEVLAEEVNFCGSKNETNVAANIDNSEFVKIEDDDSLLF